MKKLTTQEAFNYIFESEYLSTTEGIFLEWVDIFSADLEFHSETIFQLYNHILEKESLTPLLKELTFLMKDDYIYQETVKQQMGESDFPLPWYENLLSKLKSLKEKNETK